MPNDLQSQLKLSGSPATVSKDPGARTYLTVLTIVATILALLYMWCARPGSAGDEPAHWANVVFYAKHKCMPILGQPEVSYEGQMGPVYYALSAPVFALANAFNEHAGFYAIRLFDVLLVPLTVVLSYRVASLTKPGDRMFALATTTFMALNPSLLSIAASIQNDALTLVLTMVTSVVCFKCMQDDRRLIWKGALIGGLTSIAILTKATAVFLVVAIPIYAFICWRYRSAKFIASFVATLTLGTGWWFMRNVTLYGDLTAQKALTKFDYNNNPPPFDMSVWPNLRHFVWEIETYYWLPIQYYRDIFHTPTWLRTIVGVFTGLGFVGTILMVRKHGLLSCQRRKLPSSFSLFLIAQYVVCMTIFIYSCTHITHFAARVTFPTIIVYAAMIGCGCFIFRKYGKSEKVYVGLLALGLVLANAYVLFRLVIMPVFEFHHIFAIPPYL